MSELNVYHHELRHNEYAEFYLKYEADKVFAEKDAEIRKLNFQLWSARFEAAKAERDEPRMARCRYMADKFKEAKNEST